MRTEQIINSIPNWFWILILFGVALCIRLLHLTDTDIAGDEPFSIFIAHLDVPDIISQLVQDNSPPLFEILLHYYIHLFGVSDVAVRFLPAIFSAGIPPLIFLIGSRFFNIRVGIAAAILTIFSIYHIRFAHEVRVYAMFSFFTSISIYAYLAALNKPTNSWWWITLVIADVALLYSHYTSFYLIFAQLFGVITCVPFKKWKTPFLAFIVVAILYTPYLFVFIQRLGEVSSGTWVPEPGWGEIYGNVNLLLNHKYTTVGVLLALLIGAINKKFDLKSFLFQFTGTKNGTLIVISFLIPYALMFAVSKTFLPMFMDRYVLFTSIPLFLTIAWLLELFWSNSKHAWAGVVIVGIASMSTTNTNPPNNREIAQTVNYLGKRTSEGTEVYVCPEMFRMAVAYHLDSKIFQGVNPRNPIVYIDSVLAERNFHFINSSNQVPKDLKQLVYLDAASAFVYPENTILSELSTRYPSQTKKHFHEIFDVYLLESD